MHLAYGYSEQRSGKLLQPFPRLLAISSGKVRDVAVEDVIAGSRGSVHRRQCAMCTYKSKDGRLCAIPMKCRLSTLG